MRRIPAIAILALALVVSCTVQEIAEVPYDSPERFSATMESLAPDTRTAIEIGDAAARVVWREGDAIRVFSRTNLEGAKYVVDRIDGSYAEFVPDGTPSLGDGPYWAASPYDGNISFDGQTITCSPSEVQTWSRDMSGINPMTAYCENGTDFSFRNSGGVLMLRLTGDAVISSIKITDISGDRSWRLLCKENVSLSSSPDTFMVALPAGSFTGGLSVGISDASGKTFTAKASAQSKIERSVITRMPVLDCPASSFTGNDWYWTVSNLSNSPQASTSFANIAPVFSPDGSTVYFFSAAKNLIAVEVASGRVKWQSNDLGIIDCTPNSTNTQPVVNPVSGEIYINCHLSSSQKNIFAAIDPETGAILHSFPGILNSNGPGPAVSADGKVVFIGTTGATVRALDAGDFSVLGSATLSAFRGMLLVGNTLVCQGNCNETKLLTYNPSAAKGSRLTAGANLEGGVYAVTTAYGTMSPDGNTAYFPGSNKDVFGGGNPTAAYILKVNINTPSTSKVTVDGAKYVWNLLCDADGCIYATCASNSTSKGGFIRKYSADLGSVIWEWQVPSAGVSWPNGLNRATPVLDDAGHLYILSREDGSVYRIDAMTGKGSLYLSAPAGANTSANQFGCNICNGYLVTAYNGSSSGVLAAKYIGTSRPKSWSSAGGDQCCSKCYDGIFTPGSDPSFVQGGTISSIEVELEGAELQTYNFNYDSSEHFTGVTITRNGTAATHSGSWEFPSFVTMTFGSDGKPVSRKAVKGITCVYYTASRTLNSTYTWSEGNMASVGTSLATNTNFGHATRAQGASVITATYSYSTKNDPCNFGALFAGCSEDELGRWLLESWPGNSKLPSSITISTDGITSRTDHFFYTLDEKSRVKAIVRNNSTSGTRIYRINYR